MKATKIPVTMRAIVQRINRALEPNDQVLRKVRGARAEQELGEYYVLNFSRNYIVEKDVDPEMLARSLGVLSDAEAVVDR